MKTTTEIPFAISLVDDDKIFLSTLVHKLDERFKSKIDITTFSTGEEYMSQLHHKPDIIILDYYLDSEVPGAMNGIQVLKKIKSENNKATVVMLSSQDKLEIAADSIKNGAFEYVVKSESSFIRTINVVKNILFDKEIENTNKMYEKWNYLVGGLMIILLLTDIIYYSIY